MSWGAAAAAAGECSPTVATARVRTTAAAFSIALFGRAGRCVSGHANNVLHAFVVVEGAADQIVALIEQFNRNRFARLQGAAGVADAEDAVAGWLCRKRWIGRKLGRRPFDFL